MTLDGLAQGGLTSPHFRSTLPLFLRHLMTSADLCTTIQNNPELLNAICDHYVSVANIMLGFSEKYGEVMQGDCELYREQIDRHKLYDV